jgi:3-hydroxyisobutyrate dehydrogenase
MTKIAFFGVGIMGYGMARNLLRAKHEVTVYNRTRGKADALASNGAKVADSPREAAEGAEVLFSMVADDVASRAIWFGEQGALASVSPNALLVECSTLTPRLVREIAQAAGAKGCDFLDAPVTGSRPQADAGELNFLVGGSEAVLERARPVMEAMGKNFFYFGETGSGAMVKLINNMMVSAQVVAFAEGIALAEKSGLAVQKVAEFLYQGPPGSAILKRKGPAIVQRDYTPNFSLRWLRKDLAYGLDEGVQYDVPLPTIAACHELAQMAMAQGWGDKDFISFFELLCPRIESKQA